MNPVEMPMNPTVGNIVERFYAFVLPQPFIRDAHELERANPGA